MVDNSLINGKIVKSTRNKYTVAISDGLVECTIRGRVAGLNKNAIKVGDDAKITRVSDEEGVIEKILPRKSKLSRIVSYKEQIIAVNIDQIVIIMSTRQPDFKSGLLDRYLIIAEQNKLHASICINKIDLASKAEFNKYQKYYDKLGYSFIFTSVNENLGIKYFKEALRNKVSVLVGHSGVGKSSLINSIEPELALKIGEISDYTQKGQHTTTHVELFPLSFSGYIIDTPGVRELGLWDLYKDDLPQYFIEFADYAEHCKFKNCKHLKEPDCAVKAAVNAGKIFPERYSNYLNIYESLRNAHYELIKPRSLY